VTEFDRPFDEEDEQQVVNKVEQDRLALEDVRQVLRDSGYYAYGRLDDQNRWSIAVDDEVGRADVRIGDDGYEITLWASSPGLFADEENEWRRRSRNRLARLMVRNISRGQLEPNQSAEWDEVDEGVAVTEVWQLPFTRLPDIGGFVQEHLPALENVLTRIEAQLS
jgi:hypothetical protein